MNSIDLFIGLPCRNIHLHSDTLTSPHVIYTIKNYLSDSESLLFSTAAVHIHVYVWRKI